MDEAKAGYAYSISELISSASTALGKSITPAEVRALETVQEDDWTSQSLGDALTARGFIFQPSSWNQILQQAEQASLKSTIFIALESQSAWLFSWDAGASRLKGIDVFSHETIQPDEDDVLRFSEPGDKREFFSLSLASSEDLAFVPGVERHWFWSTIWTNRGLYGHAAVASLASNLFALGTSLFSMIVYNRIIPSNAMESLTVLVSGMVLVLLVDYVTKTLRNKFLSVAGVDSDLALADKLFAKVLDLRHSNKRGSVGALANTLKEFEHIREFFASATMVSLIDVPFASIFILAMYLIGGWMVAPLVIGIAILLAATFYVQPRLKALAKHSFEDGQSKHSVLVESLTGLETLKLVGGGSFMRRRLRVVLERQADVSEQMKDDTHFVTNISQTVQQFVQMSVVAVGAILVGSGDFGFGAIIACTILSGKALAPFAQLTQLLVRLNQIGVSYGALNELMKQAVEHPDDGSFLPRKKVAGSIQFKDVTFTYPDQQAPVLNKVSFKIAAGERVAILGHIGSGKTTIGRLIAGLYQPDDGTVSIDDIDIRQMAPADLRENIGMSTQDVWLMSTSIEGNISLGAVDVTTDDVLWASKIAGVADFADKHPDGYKLMLRERGESLSGGQRQAISLARALVRRPQIIVLDEPTSSMDARSEQIFVKRFKEQLPNATLVVITHRTSLLSLVERVIIMENGRVAGIGTAEQFTKAQSDRKVAEEIIQNATRAQSGRA